MISRTIMMGCVGVGLLSASLQAEIYETKIYSANSPRPCIKDTKCDIENPHWNEAITKVEVTYYDGMQTQKWTKMVHPAEGIKNCDQAVRAHFPHRFENCPEE